MTKQIQFLIILFLYCTASVRAQDVDVISNSEDPELLHVENNGSADKAAIHAVSNTTYGIGLQVNAGSMGVLTSVIAPVGYSWSYGINSIVQGLEWSYNLGAYSWVDGGEYSQNYGVLGIATGSSFGANNYGVYGHAYPDDGNSFGVFCDGDFAYTAGQYLVSDETLKQNIRPLKDGLSKVMALKPRAFEMKVNENKNTIGLAQGTQFGLIAQDVQSIAPELVRTIAIPPHFTKVELKNHVKKTPLKVMAVNYQGFIPVLLEAMQEQEAKMDSMRAEITALKAGK